MKGGARAGAGRKPGKKTVLRSFSLSVVAAAALEAVEKRKRSKFVNEAILKAIGEK